MKKKKSKKIISKKRAKKGKSSTNKIEGLFLLKTKFLYYPKSGNRFRVIYGKKSYPVIIRAIPCVFAGSNKQHREFNIRVNFHELRPVDFIEITKDSKKGYLIAVKSLL